MPFLPIIQIILFVCWYTVESFAALPAVVIFMPTIIIGVGLAFMLLAFALAAIVAWNTTKRF